MKFPIFLSLSSALLVLAAPPQPAAGKTVYNVFPKPGTDNDKTASFVTSTVGAKDLRPWTDVHEKLMHWTVEASDSQVATLKGYDGIERVAELQIS